MVEQRPLQLLVLGDVMLGRLVDQIFPKRVHNPEEYRHAHMLMARNPAKIDELRQKGHKYVWGDLLPIFEKADLRIINLETSVTDSSKKWPQKAFNYRMHPDNLKCLQEANIEYCSLANNHTLDFSEEGLFDTIKSLNDRGIKWAGVGKNRDEAFRPAILSCLGMKIACFSFADHYDMWEATDTKPGINFIDVENYTSKDIESIKKKMKTYQEDEKVDLTIVSIHWGSNYCWIPSNKFRSFAHELIDACQVDIIHGHSSHHVQGIEIYKGKPILYGCGDFVDDYAVDDAYRNDLGFAYILDINKTSHNVESIQLVPTKIQFFQASTEMPKYDKKWLLNTMTTLSAKFGTKFHESNGRLVLKKD